MKKNVVVLVNPQVEKLPDPKKAVESIPHLSPSKMTQLQLFELPTWGVRVAAEKKRQVRSKPASREVGKTSQLSHLEQSVFLLRMNFWLFNGGVVGGDGHLQQNLDTRTVKCSKNSHGLHMVFFCLSCMTPSGGAFDL